MSSFAASGSKSRRAIARDNHILQTARKDARAAKTLQRPARGISWLIVISFLITLVFGLVLAYTRFGRYTYAIGSNPEAGRRGQEAGSKRRQLPGILSRSRIRVRLPAAEEKPAPVGPHLPGHLPGKWLE